MKIEAKKIHCVFAWSWDIPGDCQDGTQGPSEEDVCGICRVSYNGTCPNCKFPGDDCPLVIGDCNHNFHVHCIQQWLDTPTAKGLCPMCRQLFSLKRGVSINEAQVEKFAHLLMKSRPTALTTDEEDIMMDQEFLVRWISKRFIWLFGVSHRGVLVSRLLSVGSSTEHANYPSCQAWKRYSLGKSWWQV